jgi:hypothetical protein
LSSRDFALHFLPVGGLIQAAHGLPLIYGSLVLLKTLRTTNQGFEGRECLRVRPLPALALVSSPHRPSAPRICFGVVRDLPHQPTPIPVACGDEDRPEDCSSGLALPRRATTGESSMPTFFLSGTMYWGTIAWFSGSTVMKG